MAERNYAEAERVVEMYFQQRDELEPVSREELLRRGRETEAGANRRMGQSNRAARTPWADT